MATFQTRHALRQLPAVQAFAAGVTITQIFEYDFTTAFVAAADRIEMGMLPAGAQIVGATVIGSAGLGAVTANVGIMSGEFGSNDNARTVGSQLFSAANVNAAEANATRAACLGVAPSENHRSIGATLSGNVAAGAGRRLTVAVEYVFG